MNAFEKLVADIFAADGYWTWTSYKVELTSKDKEAIASPSSPRWELDLIAYSPKRNELRIVECKSYLDSRGVNPTDFDMDAKLAGRYKLFTRPVHRNVILARLRSQLETRGMILADAHLRLGLAYGRSVKEVDLQSRFRENSWDLYNKDWLRYHLARMAARGWENSEASVVAKLLLVDTKGILGLPPEHPYSDISNARQDLQEEQILSGELSLGQSR